MEKHVNVGKCADKNLMTKKNLFDSISHPIPELRRDIELIPIQDNGKSLLYFHDSLGYMPEYFSLDVSVQPLLSFFTGHYSIQNILNKIGNGINETSFLDFVQLLDQNLALYSDYYKAESIYTEQTFENLELRHPILAGKSYPADPNELHTFLDSLFKKSTTKNTPKKSTALYAPHIDISIGGKQYAEAFSSIQHLKPKTVFILGTSHYAGYYGDIYQNMPFIGSKKNFIIPGKTFQTDKEIVDKLISQQQTSGFTIHDRAHRVEHSIETHLLFLSKIWTHNFTIVPILIGGLDDIFYAQSGDIATKVNNFSTQLNALSDENTFVLISGDLSHIGRKFGDQQAARHLKNSVEQFDFGFLDIASTGKPKQMLHYISNEFDATRICGFPPLYTFLKMFPEINGELINYHWWDETDKESAVSFGSIIYN